MARVKLSEHDVKRLLFPSQPVFAATTSTTSHKLLEHFGKLPLVVKVDQGIKKRGVQGLVRVGVDAKAVVAAIREWGDSWSQFLVEPLVPHEQGEERYLSFELGRDGWIVLGGDHGGIDIEQHWESVTRRSPSDYSTLIAKLEEYHLSTLELNPYVVQGGQMLALDAAGELDDTSLSLPVVHQAGLTPISDLTPAPIEAAIAKLDASTPASLKFRLINPQGTIWMLLSGGGASLVLSDEVADQGMGDKLANYGEYSGAPTDDDVYSYTKLILHQMLKSKIVNHKSLALVIAAGIANFTDVAKTFRGIIRALGEVKTELKKAQVKVFVRRGGPNEAQGLRLMTDFLEGAGIPHVIHFHTTPLTEVISEVKEYLQ